MAVFTSFSGKPMNEKSVGGLTGSSQSLALDFNSLGSELGSKVLL